MTEIIRKKLSDSPVARWTVLGVVAFTMFCGYFITDVMAPLMDLLKVEYGWGASEYGLFTGSYGFFNVFLFMLVIGGILIDKFGPRIMGVLSCLMMIVGCAVKYYAVSTPEAFQGEMFVGSFLQMKTQVFVASIGYSLFGIGVEIAGMTVTKIIARWFKGYEIALAMGLQVSVARIGTSLAMSSALPMAKYFESLSMPILIGLSGLCIGLISFIMFCVMDVKLDKSIGKEEVSKEDEFKFRDILNIIGNKGFWLIALLCVLFYSAVFPFLKYAISLMMNKYAVDESLAGLIPSLLPIGAIFLTPFFGGVYDRKGKGATIMILGAILLTVVHLMFASPLMNVWWFATILMILLGIAFSLVPSAMWPSVPKIIPQNQLGTAYGLIFWVQNIGLMCVPILIGKVLDNYCITGVNAKGSNIYDYTYPMLIFMSFGLLAVIVGLLLKREDKKKGYGLEKPNMSKQK